MKLPQILFLMAIFLAPTVQAELIFTAPPRETPEKGQKMYMPIAKYLSKATGEKVVYRYPGSWEQYSKDMRKDTYDIVFDGPHFAAWRVKHLGHQAAVKLPGNLVFVVVTHKKYDKIKKLRHLKSRKVCGLPSPNLGTVSYLSNFMMATVPPQVVEVKGGFKGVFKAFREGKCEAAILRDTVFKKMPAAKKSDLKIVYTSNSLPNQVFTVSKRVKVKAALVRAMSEKAGGEAGGLLLARFSKNSKKFLPGETAEYKGHESFLEGVVWGW